MAKKTPIDRLSATIEAVLNEYGDDVTGACKEAVTKVTRAGVKAVKAGAVDKLNVQNNSEYVKGWTSRFEEDRVSRQGIIYNKRVPGLPHLLEYGHVTRNGTGRTFNRTPAHPHIKEVEEKIASEFVSTMRKEVKGV